MPPDWQEPQRPRRPPLLKFAKPPPPSTLAAKPEVGVLVIFSGGGISHYCKQLGASESPKCDLVHTHLDLDRGESRRLRNCERGAPFGWRHGGRDSEQVTAVGGLRPSRNRDGGCEAQQCRAAPRPHPATPPSARRLTGRRKKAGRGYVAWKVLRVTRPGGRLVARLPSENAGFGQSFLRAKQVHTNMRRMPA
jgi:hypothetical protein